MGASRLAVLACVTMSCVGRHAMPFAPFGSIDGASWAKDDRGGHALRFDGKRSHFYVSRSQLTLGLREVGVEARIQTGEALCPVTVVAGQYKDPGSANNAYLLYLDRGGRPCFGVWDHARELHRIGDQTSLADGKWHRLRGGYDGKRMWLEVDGERVADGPAPERLNRSTQPLRIGRGYRTWDTHQTACGGFLGLIDDVSVYDCVADIPDTPILSFNFDEGQGACVRSRSHAYLSKETSAKRFGLGGATIVYGGDRAWAAEALQTSLESRLGDLALRLASDDQVVEPGNWRLREEWLCKPLILVGNVVSNRAMLALFAHFLAGANARYPGEGRYVLRTVFDPFRRGTDMLVLGASDDAGLKAGVAALSVAALSRGQNPSAVDAPCLPPTIEIGDASGPVFSSSRKSSSFAGSVHGVYWFGGFGAGLAAKRMVLDDISKRESGLWGFDQSGHYRWEAHYRALRQLLATGIFKDDERQLVEQRLLHNALNNSDWTGKSAMTRSPASMNGGLSRHAISGLTGQFILFEYLHHVGNVPDDRAAAVAKGHAHLRSVAESFVDQKRMRGNIEGQEGMDVLNNLAGLYLHLGDGRVVADGVLQRMADYYVANFDNLGCQAGQDSYITCRPGYHYASATGGLPVLLAGLFHRDGQYRWLSENLKRFMFSHLSVLPPPEMKAITRAARPALPERLVGVATVPMDPWVYGSCADRAADDVLTPVNAPHERTFSKAVFRDGFESDDAYLMLQGVNLGAQTMREGLQGNSIVRYTELGSLLLFHNTQRQTSWARNVVSVSRGEPDPQSAACVLKAHFESPVVSAVQSLQQDEGGVSWLRTIVRRRHGYFVVIDELRAQHDSVYRFTCRWRSFHPGSVFEHRTFEALDGANGVRFRVASATPLVCNVERQKRDGAARPTVLRQLAKVRLDAGETFVLRNLLFAANESHPRSFDVRPLGRTSVLVRGGREDFDETAAIGTGPLELSSLSATAALWYLSKHGFIASGLTSASVRGKWSLESRGGVHLAVFPSGSPCWIESQKATARGLRVHPMGEARFLVDGKPVQGDATLPAGRRALSIEPFDALLRADQELAAIWGSRRADPAATSVKSQAALPPAWTFTGIRPPHALRVALTARGEPEITGDPGAWTDRRIHYSAPAAGWPNKQEGTIVLDLLDVLPVKSVRLVGVNRRKLGQAAFEPGQFGAHVVLSNDDFKGDTREKWCDDLPVEILYGENQQYMYTCRFPVFVVPIEDRARYIKVTPRRAKGKGVYFVEVQVELQRREPRAYTRVLGLDGLAVCQSGSQMLGLSTEGKLLWQSDLGAEPVDVKLADVDGDGQREILAFTLAEKLLCFGRKGQQKFVADVYAAIGGPNTAYTPARPACIAAWRPNEHKRLEYAFFPHVRYGRISPSPQLEFSWLKPPGYPGNCGGKFALPVPDVTGDGREELGILGLYGRVFGVVPSEAPLEEGTFHYLTTQPMTGYDSGNMELPLYFDALIVRDSEGRWLGVVGVNPGGVDFYGAPDFKHKWGRFNHPPNRCHLVTDVTGDGRPEVLVGRADGYVVAYEAEDGKTARKAALDGEVRALAMSGESLLAGTEESLTLLDLQLRVLGRRPDPVESVAVVSDSGGSMAIVAHSDGSVAGYQLRGGPRE